MSERGRKFLDKWLAEQLPIVSQGDPIAASDLADQLMTAAEKAGIRANEINGEVESVFEVIFEAMRRHQAAVPGDA
ncbi:DUF768 domain-containing protein [Mesorhizobium loti]|uniref:DUF768 domain-containing protein n=1 Tax=Rhizobium loti TaxID=381 RepID=UPI0003F8B0B2|nr:DUF768 domain-containing protein [Mesorhizobium loti]